MFCFLVPSPNVGVTVSQSEPYHAGMFAELRCSIDLDSGIDTQVDVAVVWQKDGVELNETVRVRALSPHLVGDSRYDTLLQFSTLSSSIDSGNYMCMSTIFPTENRNYITNSTETTSIEISVTGMVIRKYMQMHQHAAAIIMRDSYISTDEQYALL